MKYEKGKPSDAFFLNALKAGLLSVTRDGVVTNTKTNKIVGQKTPFINLKDSTGSYGIATYRLVWLAFNGSIPEGLRVYRKNLSAGNGIDNLEVKTVSEKNRELKVGLNFKPRPGVLNAQARFTEEDVINLRKEYKQRPFSIRKRAKELGTSHPVLSGMLKGKSYANLPEAVDTISKKWTGDRKGTPRKGITMPKRAPAQPKAAKPVAVKPKPIVIKTPKVIFTEDDKNKRLALIKSLNSKMKAREV